MKQLYEANYALSERLPTKDNLVSTVLGWRLADMFIANKNTIIDLAKESIDTIATKLEAGINGLTMGFSIQSNVRGKGNAISKLVDDTSKEVTENDVVYHHVHGTHEIDEVVPLSTQQHTELHNHIRKKYKAAILGLTLTDEQKRNNIKTIDEIYLEFTKACEGTPKTYADYGARIKAYEATLIRIAALMIQLLEPAMKSSIYLAALKELFPNKKIDSLKNLKNKNQSAAVEEFKIYETLWY